MSLFLSIKTGIATAGPIPIISGGHPATVKSENLAKMGNPFFYANDLLAKRTAAAPSVVWELFPAVVLPSFLKAGFNLASVYIVVYLIPSS